MLKLIDIKQRLSTFKSRDEQAAYLYLIFWQSEEFTDLESERDFTYITEWAEKQLIPLGYPNPQNIVFDNEAQPLIKWEANFNWEEWVKKELDQED